jgi:hypothetical protein
LPLLASGRRFHLRWMWYVISYPSGYIAVNNEVQTHSADSAAIRSVRVLNVKISSISVAFWHNAAVTWQRVTASESGPTQAPTDHGRFERAAGLVVAPFPIDKAAGERQLIGAAVVLAQNLDGLIRRRCSFAVELGQTSFASCHS